MDVSWMVLKCRLAGGWAVFEWYLSIVWLVKKHPPEQIEESSHREARFIMCPDYRKYSPDHINGAPRLTQHQQTIPRIILPS